MISGEPIPLRSSGPTQVVAAADALHVHAAALGGQVRGHDEPPLGAAQLAGQVDDGAVEAPGVGLAGTGRQRFDPSPRQR